MARAALLGDQPIYQRLRRLCDGDVWDPGTAPYFHDGSAATLQEAASRMARAQLDRTLTDEQIAKIVAFLLTLTGTYRGAPLGGTTP